MANDTIYQGVRPYAAPPRVAYSATRKLCLYLAHVSHSPTGFEWGYIGSGPAQLAYALLYHHTRDRELSQDLHHRFMWQVVSRLPSPAWAMSGGFLGRWLTYSEPFDAPFEYLCCGVEHAPTAAAWVAGLFQRDYLEYAALLSSLAPEYVLGDWIEERDGDRVWAEWLYAGHSHPNFLPGVCLL